MGDYFAQDGHIEPIFVEIKAGNRNLHKMLRQWIKSGKLTTTSVVMARIAAKLHEVTSYLPRALIITDLPGDFFQDAKLTGTRDCDVI